MEATWTDTESGLDWVIKTHIKDESNWDQCKELADQFDGWRMPSIQEVLTLLNLGDFASLKTIEFIGTEIWLKHQDGCNPNNAYVMSFKTGDLHRSNKQNKRTLVLVRDTP